MRSHNGHWTDDMVPRRLRGTRGLSGGASASGQHHQNILAASATFFGWRQAAYLTPVSSTPRKVRRLGPIVRSLLLIRNVPSAEALADRIEYI
jgi:hypothetical protein